MTGRQRLEVGAPPIPFDEAIRRVRIEVHPLPSEQVSLEDAYDRVLATSLRAPCALPPFEASSVDGWAVRSEDVVSAREEAPVALDVIGEVTAGRALEAPIASGQAARIMTGAPLPAGADAVVMLEWTEWTDRRVFVRRAAATGRAVRRVGEDVGAGDEVLAAGRALSPADVGLLASLGITKVPVHRQPRVALLVTGDELLDAHEELRPGKIRSSNDWTLLGHLRAAGAIPQSLGIGRDDLADLARRIEQAHGADVLVTSGGVSVGDRDLLREALAVAGFSEIFWRVASSPGKPLVFGRLGDTLVFGLPGNPVSSLVAFENFVRPALRRLQGDAHPERARVLARVEERFSGSGDRRHFARVRLAYGPDGYRVREVGPRGSGNLFSMVMANGLAIVPEGRKLVEAGETVEVIVLGAAETDATVG